MRTAKGDAEYNADWNGIDSSDDPTLATLRRLHSARQMVDTSRWWTLRWPNSAISLLGTACGLSTEGTFKLLRRLRKVTVHHVRELWAVVMDRRHAADNVAKRAALQEEWLKLYRVLANMRNRIGKLMPGWITLQQKPIHTIKSQLVQWRKLRRMQVATGGQRGITSYFPRAPARVTRSAKTPNGGSAAAATAATSPAATAAGQTSTATTVSLLQRQAPEHTTEQQRKRHRQHDDDDPDGAASESLPLANTDPASADHDASTASAALLRAATAAPQATTTATAESSKRQLTVAESFQRTTRRRAVDPGAAARPLPDAPPLTADPNDHS